VGLPARIVDRGRRITTNGTRGARVCNLCSLVDAICRFWDSFGEADSLDRSSRVGTNVAPHIHAAVPPQMAGGALSTRTEPLNRHLWADGGNKRQNLYGGRLADSTVLPGPQPS
jgi:hypothetical protein